MNELIKLENVTIGFGKTPILSGINLALKADEFWGVIGPNGGGKSTLLKTLIGLKDPVLGSCHIKDGISFGYVPQNDHYDTIFPIIVEEIVSMGRYSRVPFGRRMKIQDRLAVKKSLERAGASKLTKKLFRELSGGEKQKVLIAKAICGEPDILVLDEPTASLDISGEAEVMSLIQNLKDELNLTVVMVSHFADTIRKYTDKVMLVDKDNVHFSACTKDEAVSSHKFKRYFGLPALT